MIIVETCPLVRAEICQLCQLLECLGWTLDQAWIHLAVFPAPTKKDNQKGWSSFMYVLIKSIYIYIHTYIYTHIYICIHGISPWFPIRSLQLREDFPQRPRYRCKAYASLTAAESEISNIMESTGEEKKRDGNVSKMALKYGLLDLANLLIWNWTLSKVFFQKNVFELTKWVRVAVWICKRMIEVVISGARFWGNHMKISIIWGYLKSSKIGPFQYWTPHVWVLSQLVRRWNSSVDHCTKGVKTA